MGEKNCILKVAAAFLIEDGSFQRVAKMIRKDFRIEGYNFNKRRTVLYISNLLTVITFEQFLPLLLICRLLGRQ